MGNRLLRPCRRREIRVVLLGLDGSGKTTLINSLMYNRQLQAIPTIGFNVQTVSHMGVEFVIYDVGGSPKNRQLWGYYAKICDAMIFVVDSGDRDRVSECRQELVELLLRLPVKKRILLVYANKQDLPTAMTCVDIANSLGLNSLPGTVHQCHAVCAATGKGIFDGLNWLEQQLC